MRCVRFLASVASVSVCVTASTARAQVQCVGFLNTPPLAPSIAELIFDDTNPANFP